MTPDTPDLPETTAPRLTPSTTQKTTQRSATTTLPKTVPTDEPPAVPNRTASRIDAVPETPRAKLLDLSVTQLIGGSMAAATAAALGSRLGVVGTIAGAAVGSVVTATAASLYTGSMARAREVLVATRAMGRVPTTVTRPEWWRLPDRAGTRRLLATTGVVFLVAAGFLAGLQLATGTSVTGTSIGTRQAGRVVETPKEQSDTEGTSTTPTAPLTTGTPTGSAQPTIPATRGAPTSSGTATVPAQPATPAATTGTSGATEPVGSPSTPTPTSDGAATSTAAAG